METKKAKLDFIGIGPMKAGSTWLWGMLNQHPDVSFGRGKEIHFFNDRQAFYTRQDHWNNYAKGIDWYMQQLQLEGGKVNGEITPNYIYDEVCAERIHKHFPDVKLVSILRDPAERAYSEYFASTLLMDLAESFEEAIQKYPEYVDKGYYYRQLRRYYDLFPGENIKVCLFEDIKNDAEGLIKDVERFLGLREFVPPDMSAGMNPTRQQKYPWVRKVCGPLYWLKGTNMGHKLLEIPFISAIKDAAGRFVLRNTLEDVRRPLMSESTRQYLAGLFRDDIEKLEKLLGRDLSVWKR